MVVAEPAQGGDRSREAAAANGSNCLPDAVDLVDVAPRDGLQNESAVLDTVAKLHLIDRLVAAGVRRIEVASFAHPKRVPSMADAEALCAALPRQRGVSFSGLVLNEKGYERARRAALDEVTMVVVATDSFSEKNQGLTTKEAAEQWCRIAAMARQDGIRSSVTIAAVFGCPYEGLVPIERIVEVAVAIAAGGPDEIVMADTIGVGVPTQVDEIVSLLREAAPGVRLRGHFHDTRNTAAANAVASLRAGVTALDASVGGIGGCPFAPGASGNVATEDLVYTLEGMGVATGIDLVELVAIVPWLERQLGHQASGHVSKVSAFPRVPSARDCFA